MTEKVLVTGGAGFVGSHLIRYLKNKGYWVRGVDIRKPLSGETEADEHDWDCDLRTRFSARWAVSDMDEVYALAADMGGMGYISSNHFGIMSGNALINVNTATAISETRTVKRVLFSSSACCYPEHLQRVVGASPLREHWAWRGMPDLGYGVEKLFSERLYIRMGEVTDTEVRVARFHNIYGTGCAYDGGREKAPAALCRKVRQAILSGSNEIEIWGDGLQRRSFCYITDCLSMIDLLMQSNYREPLNIGSDRSVSVSELADIVILASGGIITKRYVETNAQGVRGRNADLVLMRKVIGYDNFISLEDGIAHLYSWVCEQLAEDRGS